MRQSSKIKIATAYYDGSITLVFVWEVFCLFLAAVEYSFFDTHFTNFFWADNAHEEIQPTSLQVLNGIDELLEAIASFVKQPLSTMLEYRN